jgi:hypothetical protein
MFLLFPNPTTFLSFSAAVQNKLKPGQKALILVKNKINSILFEYFIKIYYTSLLSAY